MKAAEKPGRTGLVLILCAFVAYLAANVIHNNFGLDPAIAPAAVFLGLLLWRPRRGLLLAAAMVILLPAFAFFRWSELITPASTLHFLNHLALLAAGLLGVASAAVALAPRRRVSPS